MIARFRGDRTRAGINSRERKSTYRYYR